MGGRRGGNMVRHLASCMTVLATLLALPAGAADLKVISAGAVRRLIAQSIEDYSLKTGQKVEFTIGPTRQVRSIIATGQHPGPIIGAVPLVAELRKTGQLK